MITAGCHELIIEAFDVHDFGVFANFELREVANSSSCQTILQVYAIDVSLFSSRKEEYWSVFAHSHAGDVIGILAVGLAYEH